MKGESPMNEKNMTFEQSMQRLEQIVRSLERGDAPLEESLKLFQEGKKKSPDQLFSSRHSQPPCHESPTGRHWVPLRLKYTAGGQS